MSAFKERLLLEEIEFNYHLTGPRFPLQDIVELDDSVEQLHEEKLQD
jgi:hypothetical protein